MDQQLSKRSAPIDFIVYHTSLFELMMQRLKMAPAVDSFETSVNLLRHKSLASKKLSEQNKAYSYTGLNRST